MSDCRGTADDITICDINFGVNNRQEIKWKKERGLVARKKDKTENEAYLLNRQGRYTGRTKLKMEAKHTVLQAKFDRACRKVEKEETKKKATRATTAFVTFTTEQGYTRARNLYPNFGFLHRLTMKKELKTAGGYRLVVSPAPEPSEVIWENLGISDASRFCRVSFTTLATMALLLVSFAFIYSGSAAQKTAELKYPANDCSDYIVYPDPLYERNGTEIGDASIILKKDVEYDVNWEHYNQTL